MRTKKNIDNIKTKFPDIFIDYDCKVYFSNTETPYSIENIAMLYSLLSKLPNIFNCKKCYPKLCSCKK